MKNKIFYLIISLFFYACSNEDRQKTEIIKNFELNVIKGDIVIKGNDDLLIVFDLIVTDSLLTIINFEPKETFFYSYNLNDLKKKKVFGHKGRGPNDFLSPQFYNNVSYSNTLQVFDMNTVRTSTINFTYDSVNIYTKRLDPALVGAFNMGKTGEIYYGIKASGADPNGLFSIYDNKANKLEWVKYSSPRHENIKSLNKFFLYYNYLTVNENENLICVVLRHFNKILFYDLEGKHLKSFQMGENELYPKWNEKNGDMDYSSITYFLDVCMSDKYVYCLWVERGDEVPEVNSKIFIFNIDMEYITTLQMDRPLSRIQASKDNSIIYASSDDGTGLSDIIKYDISNILN